MRRFANATSARVNKVPPTGVEPRGRPKVQRPEVTVVADAGTGTPIRFTARVRIDTPNEREYYRNGGILHYVLRQLAREAKAA